MKSLQFHGIWLFALLTLVYVLGMFLPLMQNDSAQHAVMAMQIYQNGDYLSLFRGNEAYLDKPHLHFWLSAFSYEIFGIKEWAYRLPSFLMTILGAYSLFKLGIELMDKRSGLFSALIFLSYQTIILANHDVRTDAILTGVSIFSIWQFILFFKYNKISSSILAGIALGLSFSTKGYIGPMIIVGACIGYIQHQQLWKSIFTPKLLLVIFSFLLAITPVLFAYHSQFGAEGVRFILWEQYLERFQADGFEESSPDYFFFFHSLIWVALPFSILLYTAFFDFGKNVIISRFKNISLTESVVFGGVAIPIILFSLSSYKLPHYLNVFMPLLALASGTFLASLKNENRYLKWLYYTQWLILIIAVTLVGYLHVNSFSMSVSAMIFTLLTAIVATYNLIKHRTTASGKTILISGILTIVSVNLYLNSTFYPQLLEYQGSRELSRIIETEKIPVDKIWALRNNMGWTLNFERKSRFKTLTSPNDLATLSKPFYVIAFEDELQTVQNIRNDWSDQFSVDDYPVTRLTGTFLNKNTRPEKLRPIYLLVFE